MIVVTDTGPLWSFALVGRLELLGRSLSERVCWTSAVANEITHNSIKEPLLKHVLSQTWLPEPIEITDIDLVNDIARVQRSLAAPGDHYLKHLGEAESIVHARTLGDAKLLT